MRFRILLSDKNVKAVSDQYFRRHPALRHAGQRSGGGRTRPGFGIPIVVRMEGTNVELGRQILKESGLNFTVAEGT